MFLLIVQIYLGGTELVWTNSISPYPGQLGKMLNVFCYLLPAATQKVCNYSSAGCRHVVEICLRAMESGNQLDNCLIWDIAIEESSALRHSTNIEN